MMGRILILEDNKKIANFIKRGFEENGFEVEIENDGEDGYQKALDGSYNLIILEVNLSMKGGLSVVRDLRASKIFTPVLFLTGSNSIDDIVAGLDAGADDYLTKPFAFDELLARVRAILRRVGRERGTEIVFADLRLDPVTHRAWRNGKEIVLTGREYNLLHYFVSNPNQILSKSVIAENVFTGFLRSEFTNIINVYINCLRKKIDQDSEIKLIHTVRKEGYILRD